MTEGNDYTRRNANIFQKGLQRIQRTITPTTTGQYIGIIGCPFILRQFWFIPDAAGTNPNGVLSIFRGSTLAVANAAAAAVVANADQNAIEFVANELGVTATNPYKTRTDAQITGAAGDFITCKAVGNTGTWPAGLVIVEFVLADT